MLKRLNHKHKVDFSLRVADLKKHVSIYTRKQIGQEREGVCAC